MGENLIDKKYNVYKQYRQMNLVNPYRFGKKLNQFLVAYYKFDNDAVDSTGLSPTGVPVGTSYVTGKLGNCIDFNSSFNRVEIANNSNFTFTDGVNDIPFTMSFWITASGFSSTGNWLINKRADSNTTMEYQLVLLNNGRLNISKFDKLNGSSAQEGITTASPVITSLNTWYHVVYTNNGSDMAFYVNSVKVAVNNTSSGTYTGMPVTPNKTVLGMSGWTSSSSLRHQGKMDEVAIWKGKALNQDEVNDLYNLGTGKTYPF